ncbi:MAG: hypothetical protein JW857_06040 [Bacteroidales bacterium]|nr:hypothetical protein [Bacteroidales bacterium]
MKTNYLLPYSFKKIGWLIFIPSFILGILWLIFDFEPAFLDVNVIGLFSHDFMKTRGFIAIFENNIANELIGVFIIVSGIFVAFAKEKNEDEFISKIRLESLLRATYLNYGILVFALIFIYDKSFFTVMIVNMFTVLLFFILHFNWALYKSKKAISDAK